MPHGSKSCTDRPASPGTAEGRGPGLPGADPSGGVTSGAGHNADVWLQSPENSRRPASGS